MIETDARVADVVIPEHEVVADAIRGHLRSLLRTAGTGQLESIEGDVSFDMLGLDSLGRVQLVEELGREFSVELEATAAYDFATVHALAHLVHARLTGTPLDERSVLEV